MARRNQNLAGLAALGALGYALTRGGNKAPVEDRIGVSVGDSDVAERADRMTGSLEDLSDQDGGGITAIRGGPSGRASVAPAALVAPAMMSQEEMARRRLAGGPRGRTESAPTRVAGQGGPRGTRYSPTDTGDETARLARRYPGTAVDRIPGSSPAGWTGGKGERVTGNETTRNLSNIMNATAGLSVPGYVGKMTQAQYNARAAARRANEGLSDAEAAAVLRQRALSEADTSGGAIGYKKGGAVKAKAKKMASGGMTKSSVSKRADGIATKGKTKCKMY